MSFTGNKDKDLCKIFRINKYCKNLLRDKKFWDQRILKINQFAEWIFPYTTYKNLITIKIQEKIRHGKLVEIKENASDYISKVRRFVYVTISNMNIEGFINRTTWKKICKKKHNLLMKRVPKKGIFAYDIFDFSNLDYHVEYLSSYFRNMDLSKEKYIEVF
jgi:hypothetical protein